MSSRERRRPTGKLPTNQAVKYYSSGKSGPEPGKSPFKLLPGSRRSTILGRFFDLGILLVVLMVAGLLLIVRPPAKVTADSEVYNKLDAYAEAANGYINGLAFKNKVTFDETQLQLKMRAQFPEISGMDVELPILSPTPRIALRVHAPVIALASQSGRYIVDSQGRAVGQSSDFADIDGLISVSDESGFEVQPGQPVLSRSSVEFIEALSGHLSKNKIPVESISLPARPQELILKTKDQDYFVKFHLGGNPAAQIGQYLAALQHFDNENITPSEYLDARVPGRVFYK